jgi:hypothetical protein
MNKQEIIYALVQVGFEQPYENWPHTLRYQGYDVTVKDSDTLATIFTRLIEMGKTLKCWEIKSVLEIV